MSRKLDKVYEQASDKRKSKYDCASLLTRGIYIESLLQVEMYIISTNVLQKMYISTNVHQFYKCTTI